MKKWFQVPRSFILGGAESFCNKVSPVYVPEAEVNNQPEKLKERWNRCRAIPWTHAIHFASKVGNVTSSVAKPSQFLYNEHTRKHVLIVDQVQSETPTAQ